MNQHVENAAYGFVDYAAYPVGMLLVAPVLLHSLGAESFGVWAFAMVAINTGAIVASGFSDANIQQVAAARSDGNLCRIQSCVQATVAVHLLLGSFVAAAVWLSAPAIAPRLAGGTETVHGILVSLRIAAVAIFFRALETVAISTNRAFERYCEAVRISAFGRVLSLALAAGLASAGWSVARILACSTLLLAAGTLAQYLRLSRVVPARALLPRIQPTAVKALLNLGVYTWIQACVALVFNQADRLLVGVWFGSVAAGAYTLCMQLAQIINGSAASGLHFVMPYLARVGRTSSPLASRVTIAFVCNVALVATEAALLLCFGLRLLTAWTTPAATHIPPQVFVIAVIGSACAALAVTGAYAMLALGRAGAVLGTTFGAGAVMLALMFSLHGFALTGLAISRLGFGVTSLLIYIPLVHLLRSEPNPATPPSLRLVDAQEGV